MGDKAAMEATTEEETGDTMGDTTEEDMGDTTEVVEEEVVIAATVAATEITVGA